MLSQATFLLAHIANNGPVPLSRSDPSRFPASAFPLSPLSRFLVARRPAFSSVAVPRRSTATNDGRWRPLIVSTTAGDNQAEPLRLMFSGVAAPQRGFDPGGPGWWVHPSPDGKLVVDVQIPFSHAAIEHSVIRWLEQGK